jgi:hypothetical protein
MVHDGAGPQEKGEGGQDYWYSGRLQPASLQPGIIPDRLF